MRCKMKGCDGDATNRGLCKKHYQQWIRLKAADPEAAAIFEKRCMAESRKRGNEVADAARKLLAASR